MRKKTQAEDIIEVRSELPRIPVGAVTRERLLAEVART